jgi:hypothetical protein
MLMIALPSKVFQLVAFQKFRQLGDVHRNSPRLIFGEQFGCGIAATDKRSNKYYA